MSAATWDAVCVRALIGLAVMGVGVIAMTSFAVGFRTGRRR